MITCVMSILKTDVPAFLKRVVANLIFPKHTTFAFVLGVS